jgi:hypothetical protein
LINSIIRERKQKKPGRLKRGPVIRRRRYEKNLF